MKIKYMDEKDTMECYGLTRARLLQIVSLGLAKTVKVGESRSAKRLYCSEDIDALMDKMAKGTYALPPQDPEKIGRVPK